MSRELASSRSRSGAQTVDRACLLMREIAEYGAEGARITDLTNRMGLSRPTVHRILRSLAEADFVRQEPATRRYRLGLALHGLALAAPNPLDQLANLRPLLESLAQRTGETVYLMMRQGDEVRCMARVEGTSPIRTLLIDVGAMRPIGTVLAGITMLAPLSEEEIDTILRRTTRAMARHRNATPAFVRRHIAEVRRNGFCFSKSVLIEGATGISAPVPSIAGPPFLAVSLSAVTSQVPESRIKPLAHELLRTCARIGQHLKEQR